VIALPRRRLALAALALAAAAAGARADGPPCPGRVSGAEARRLVAEGAALVDVRRAEDFDFDHLDGAINVPLEEIPDRLAEIGPASLPVVVYCDEGKRSAEAARLLVRLGYARVHDLGPMSAW